MIPVIPYPNQINSQQGEIIFSVEWKITCSQETEKLAKYLQEYIQKFSQKELKIQIQSESEQKELLRHQIYLKIESDVIDSELSSLESDESYHLLLNPDEISLTARSQHGLFNSIQTFLQLILHFVTQKNTSIPAMDIVDSPRFQYRGFMLDVGRHFHSIDQIKELLDIMALFKLNRFHWHLTEDQGWRIEIKAFPKLTEIGSHRADTQIGGFGSRHFRGKPHGGFYTQQEIKDVVQYAKDRWIQVIPEIDIPGHSQAAIAAYPELSCRKENIGVATKSGIFPTIYCAGQESTYQFLEQVFDEICEIFDSDIIHIGGDEAPKKYWKKCAQCQQKIQTEGLQDEEHLQTYFTNRIATYLKSKGKRIMGWNEIVSPQLQPDAIIHYWIKHEDQVKQAVEGGHKMINSHFFHYYLDYKYCLHPLRKVYNYDPVFPDLSPIGKNNIIGVEAPLWTEWVPTRDRLHWQAFPRLFAMAETAWTHSENKKFKEFKMRLRDAYPWLIRLDIKLPPFSYIDPSGIKRSLQLLTARRMPKI